MCACVCLTFTCCAKQHKINMLSFIDYTLYKAVCPNCNKIYKHRRNMLRHMHYECGKTAAFQCLYCTRCVKQKYNLFAHVSGIHPEKAHEFSAKFKYIKPVYTFDGEC